MTTPHHISRYELIERLGEGGFGVVWRAHDPNLGRTVAVKVLWPHLAREEDVVRRFLHEGRIAANTVHPNVVQVFDAGSEGDSHYLVMEYVPGSLERVLRERGSLPLPEALDLTRQVLQGLAAAHRQGVTHRDVKPANVLIASDPSAGSGQAIAKVSDFGIARAADLSRLSRSGYGIGTPRYMAPEQFEGNVDGRSDLYSVGVMLYELISGATPFQGNTPYELMRQHFDAPIPRLPATGQVPAAVQRIVDTAMAKRPEDRFQTAEAMVSAIGEALSPRQVPATPPRVASARPPPPPPRPPSEPSIAGDGSGPSRRAFRCVGFSR